MEIIIKQSYNHFNKALGVHVKNKDHYDRLMKEGNYCSYEQSIENGNNSGKKPYILSKEAENIIREAKLKRDSKGKVKLDGKFGEKLVKIGAINKKIPDYMKLPSAYTQGGFTQ